MKQWNEEERIDLYSMLKYNHGEKKQVLKAIEELAELQQALCKWLIMDMATHNRRELIDELADARIMIEQVEYFGNLGAEVNGRIKQKLERQLERENER